MKKGFTIVELAIVLVVIGIILAMAVKGRALVETARYKAEVNKVRKLEAAVHIWLVTHPEFMVAHDTTAGATWGDIDMNYFFEQGILNRKEIESLAIETISGRNKPGYWTPMRCQYIGDAIAFYKGENQGTEPWAPTNFCARIFLDVADNGTMYTVNVPPRLQCMIEVLLDDESLSSGAARYTNRHPLKEFTREEYRDCMALPMAEPSDRDMGVVLY